MMHMPRGQTVLEYTMLIGIVTVVLVYMGTGIKRSVQSLVKVTADQIGNQQNADQDFNDIQQGYMIGSNSAIQESRNKQVTELGYIPAPGTGTGAGTGTGIGSAIYITNITVNESSDMQTNTITNGGFTPTN